MKLGPPENFKPHWKVNLSNEEYHSDRDFVSSSQLKSIITESPAYFKERFDGKPRPKSEAMAIGTLVHHAVLEGEDFIKRYVVMPKFDGHANSLIHKAAKKEWLDAHKNKVIVTEDEIEIIQGTYESIFKHTDACYLLKDSEFERSGYYVDPTTGIRCRIRYDAYNYAERVLIDLKTVRSCKREGFAFSIRDYRYDLSMAMYGDGIGQIDGKAPTDFVFIAVEKTAPFHCAVYALDQRSLNIGFNDYQNSLSLLRQSIETNHWPSYQEEIEEIGLPESFKKRYAHVN
jgi:hypothetical protein